MRGYGRLSNILRSINAETTKMDLRRHRLRRRLLNPACAYETEEEIYLDDSTHEIEILAGSDAQMEERNHNGKNIILDLRPREGLIQPPTDPYDFTIHTIRGSDAETVSIQFHKSYLSMMSSVFKAMFESDMEESKKNEMTVVDFTHNTIQVFHDILYKPYVGEDKINASLMRFADKYDIGTLYRYCRKNILENVRNCTICFTDGVVIDLLKFADLKDDEELFVHIGKYLYDNCGDKTEEWKEFIQENPVCMAKLASAFMFNTYNKYIKY